MKQDNDTPVVVKGLRKSFGKQRVLDGLDLNVSHGETVAILGRSGTGKSVLLKLLIRLQTADSGTIQILGKEVGNLAPGELNEIRKKMGFLFQEAALYDSLTVEENVEFPLRRHTQLSDAELKNKARELLASVGMDKNLDKLPSELSGGMKKRVGLARALALEPEILLFDEPTAGLDPVTAEEIGKLISELKEKRKITSVLVTHDIQVTREVADRLVLINEGKVVAEGSFEDLKKSRDELAVRFLRECS